MALTFLKAFVNMTNANASLTNTENGVTLLAHAHSIISCPNWPVPWCSNATGFGGHHLKVEFTDSMDSGRRWKYYLWQESFGGNDRIRFVLDDIHEYRSPTDPRGGSRLLASNRDSSKPNWSEYIVQYPHSDAILTIDDQPWVIMYKVGV